METRLCNLNEIAPGIIDLHALARLVFHALPDFYEMIPLSSDAVLDLIVDEMHIKGTECCNPLIALADEAPVAVICSYPLEELSSRQQASLLQTMRKLDRSGRKVFRELVAKRLSVAEIRQENARYIARIAVVEGKRGQGIGKKVFSDFVVMDPNRPIALHVDRRNDAAIAYYRRLGFEFVGPDRYNKLAMIWRRKPISVE